MRIFTDASTSSKISGVAFVITDNEHNVLVKKSKTLIESDNNFAELAAILFALEEIGDTNEQIIILSDSKYALNCIHANACRKFERPLMDLIQHHLSTKSWQSMWIKGHKNDGTMLSAFNREADHMANNVRKAFILKRRQERHRKQQLIRQNRLTLQKELQYD